MSLTTLAPPAVAFLLGTIAVRALPRRAGHVVAALAAATVVPWAVAVPAGTHLPASVFGFDVQLLAVDGFSRAAGFVFGVVAVGNVSFCYGSGATRRQTATGMAYMTASLAAVFVGDWLTLVVTWELMAVAATVLVWQSADAVRAGYRYAVYHQLGGILLVAGVIAQFTRTGTFLYGDGVAAGLPTILAAAGVLVNVGVLGVHVWIVDTYPRPHVSTSVVVSGFTTKVGVYALVRVVPDGSTLLVYAGLAMLLIGVTFAILQTGMRRLLSYHIVSQVGYMVVGVGVATGLGQAGAMAHLVNNVLYKSLLFMVAGVLVLGAGTDRLKAVTGGWRARPRTAAAFVVAALSITGIPGFAGFVSKGMIVDSVDAAGFELVWWGLLAGGVGTVVSFVKFGYYAFRETGHDGPTGGTETATRATETATRATEAQTTRATEAQTTRTTEAQAATGATATGATTTQTVAMAVLAVPCVVIGLAPDLLFAVLPPGTESAKVFAVSQYEKAGALAVMGTIGFVALRDRLARLPVAPDLDRFYHPGGAWLRGGVVSVVGEAAVALDALAGRTLVVTEAAARDPRVGATRTTVGGGVLLVVVTTAVIVLVALL